jgi:hypothetical protein
MNILLLLKKRFLDIILIVVVFGLFFLSGSEKELPEKLNAPLPAAKEEPEIKPVSTPFTIQSDDRNKPVSPSLPIPSPSPYAPMPSPSNITSEIPHNPYQELKNSFEQIEGGTVSTEAIIERNTYFRKLSEQLKDLQGEVSTDSTSKEVLIPDTDLEDTDLPMPPEELLDDPELLDELMLEELNVLQ